MYFDVWVNGPVASMPVEASRAELLRRIEALHPVARADGEAFVRGAPLKLRRGISEDAALLTLAKLQELGAAVEVEANRPHQSLLMALDEFDAAEAQARADEDAATLSTRERMESSNPEIVALVDAAKLLALSPPPPGSPSLGPSSTMQSVAVPLAGPVPLRPLAHVDTAPMRPAGGPREADDDATAPMACALELDRPMRPSAGALEDTAPMELPSTRPGAGRGAQPSSVLTAAGAEEAAPPARAPGRIAGGALRDRPAVRVGAGLVIGLGLGWALSQPYAGRAERRVAELRAQADRERYRPVAEAQTRVAALDSEADAAASRAALGAGAIWLVVGAGAFAAWWRLT